MISAGWRNGAVALHSDVQMWPSLFGERGIGSGGPRNDRATSLLPELRC